VNECKPLVRGKPRRERREGIRRSKRKPRMMLTRRRRREGSQRGR
jgi:hypothetical protein